MRVAVTGTPGTGKTTAVRMVDTPLSVIHLNEIIRDRGLHRGMDEDRDTLIADLDGIRTWLGGRDDLLIESHLAHLLDVDRVIVLRCRPDILEARLRDRGESPEKARENAESEALDVILSEVVRSHGPDRVYEIDTTELGSGDVARAIEKSIAGERQPSAGEVDFLGYL